MSESNVFVENVSGRTKPKLSRVQIDAIEARSKLRQRMLAGFVHAHQTGCWLNLITFFAELQAEFETRQGAEDRIAYREMRKPRKVSRKLSSCAYVPTSARPLYINVKVTAFDDGKLRGGPDYYVATPSVAAQLNNDFAFELANPDCVCDLVAVKNWLIKTATDHDASTLRGLGELTDLNTVMDRIKLPEGATLVYVPAVYYTDIYATNFLDRLYERNKELAQVVEYKMLWNNLIAERY